ncbi:MAG: methyl-accepting chemotaxis protein [Comamonadaceae bacterium]|nr:methyl-accepting chemotaxis protein [Comamonadaceae bacterium]
MKGMLDFLEKAGLVTRDEPLAAAPPEALELGNTTPLTAGIPPSAAPVDVASAPPVSPAGAAVVALSLDTIYASAGIALAQYPAERLLRLMDGLSAMDPATRLMAIKAMDAADESWTIADPLADADAKVLALAAHGDTLKANLQQLEQQTQAQLDQLMSRQEAVVGDIRKQISELEALVERELARTAQEVSLHQGNLAAARSQTSAELNEMGQISQRLQSLSTQFGTPTIQAKE